MELAIMAVSGAVVTIAAVVAMFILGKRAADAESRCADARVDAAQIRGSLAISVATIATKTNEADAERKRADALDDELSKAEANPDPHGARDLVLSRWRAERAAADPATVGGSGAMPAPLATTTAADGSIVTGILK